MAATYNAPGNLGTPEPIATKVTASNTSKENYLGTNMSTNVPQTVPVTSDSAKLPYQLATPVSPGIDGVTNSEKKDAPVSLKATSPAGFTLYQNFLPQGP